MDGELRKIKKIYMVHKVIYFFRKHVFLDIGSFSLPLLQQRAVQILDLDNLDLSCIDLSWTVDADQFSEGRKSPDFPTGGVHFLQLGSF